MSSNDFSAGQPTTESRLVTPVPEGMIATLARCYVQSMLSAQASAIPSSLPATAPDSHNKTYEFPDTRVLGCCPEVNT